MDQYELNDGRKHTVVCLGITDEEFANYEEVIRVGKKRLKEEGIVQKEGDDDTL